MKTKNVGFGLLLLLSITMLEAQPQDLERDRDRYEKRGRPDFGDDRHDSMRKRNNPKMDPGWKREHRTEDSRNSAWFNADYRWGSYKRYVTYNYHRHNQPQWAPRYGHRYNTRYIFYEDHNIYYDCHRDLFILWTGRHWVTTARVPKVMSRIDFNRTRIQGVDYWDDDLDRYLNRKRPEYLNLIAGW